MKRIITITSLLTVTLVTSATPVLAGYYNENCSSYGSSNSCSGSDSYGGQYRNQGSQIGNSYYGSERYRSGQSGYDYEDQYNTQKIGNTTYENHRVRTPSGDVNVRCTNQYIGSQVYRNCN